MRIYLLTIVIPIVIAKVKNDTPSMNFSDLEHYVKNGLSEHKPDFKGEILSGDITFLEEVNSWFLEAKVRCGDETKQKTSFARRTHICDVAVTKKIDENKIDKFDVSCPTDYF